MSACLIDSSAFLSIEAPDDTRHDETSAWYSRLLEEHTQLVTTNFIFDEAYTLLLVRLGRSRAVEWGESIRASDLVQLVRVDRDHEERAWEIIREYEDKDFSYTDATCFAVAEALGIHLALSLDRHFVQYGRLRVVPDIA